MFFLTRLHFSIFGLSDLHFSPYQIVDIATHFTYPQLPITQIAQEKRIPIVEVKAQTIGRGSGARAARSRERLAEHNVQHMHEGSF